MKKSAIVSKLLAVLAILISIPLLYEGISAALQRRRAEQSYLTAEAFVCDYSEVAGTGAKRHRTYYVLTYCYSVGEETYFITDELMLNALPPADYSREVLYDPAQPRNALMRGKTADSGKLLLGLLFLLVPAVMLFAQYLATHPHAARAVSLFEVLVGVVLAAVGLGAVYGMTGTLSLAAAFRQYGVAAAIPVLLILAGVFQTAKSLLGGSFSR